MKKYIATAVFIIAGLLTASAQQTPKVDARQKVQHVRMAEGVQSGDLTRRETASLRQDQRELRRMERYAKSDGTVTATERAVLNRKQNKNSRAIARKKNNGRTRN